MVLVTHKLQGSHVTFPSTSTSWSKGLNLKRRIATVRVVGRQEKRLSLKQNNCLSIRAPYPGGLKPKPLRILSFKGGAQNNDSGGRETGTSKNSVKLSYISENDEDKINGSPKAQNYSSETEEAVTVQPAIHKLFKKWITMLRTQSPIEVVDKVVDEGPSSIEMSETVNEIQKTERVDGTKTVLSHFWSLDATIKIPLLIFVPGVLAVNVLYGAQVAKELIPLWIFGPLIVALYIKMIRALCALYVFTFKQTVKIVKNLPAYYLVAYNYVAQGKLKDDLRAHFWQPVVDIKNMDYKELSRMKLKGLQEWLKEKYLDFVESIWPFYCQTIRFLKRANLL